MRRRPDVRERSGDSVSGRHDELVAAIREAGRYAFRDEPRMVNALASEYLPPDLPPRPRSR